MSALRPSEPPGERPGEPLGEPLGERAGRPASGLLRTLRGVPGSVLTFWRRSLRTRVVTAIVLLCAVVVGSVGWMVMRQIADGLVKSRVAASVAEARTETATARERLSSAGGNDFDPETQLRLLVENLVARGEVKGFEVVVLGPVGEGTTTGGVRTTPAVDETSVPATLRRSVEDAQEGLAPLAGSGTHRASTVPRAVPPSPGSPSAPPWCCPRTVAATRCTTSSRWRRRSRPSCCCDASC
jgi:two-component system sensor histidine kinase MtrB